MKKIGILILMLTTIFVGKAQNKVRTVFEDADFVIEPLNSINTIGSDISPAVIAGELYFSAVPEKYFNKSSLERKNKAFYDTYSAAMDENGMTTSGRKLVPGFGENYHEGPVDFCQATGELFTTLSNLINPDTIHRMISIEDIRLRLVIMKKKDGKWEITEELPFNDSKFNFAHPAISQTGDTLVFSSDMNNENLGKSDLYMSVRTNGKWSAPHNLGSVINTSGNEMFPSFLPGGLLAFASDGHLGLYGRLDIWYTRFPNSESVINAGNKINSDDDDFGLIISPNRKTGYFSSNRPGKGSDDIYLLQIISLYETLKGKVTDTTTGQFIAGTQLKLVDCDGKTIAATTSDEHGDFKFEVPKNSCATLEAAKTGYENESKVVTGSNFVEMKPKKQIPVLTVKIIDKDSGKELSNCTLEVLEGDINSLALQKVGQHFQVKLNSLSNYMFYASKEGYYPAKMNYSGEGKSSENDSLIIPLEKLTTGKKLVIEDLYFDLDKYNIRPDAALVLDRLAKVMTENPGLKIELGSHTDCRSSSSYNMRLSQNRSNSVVAYLEKNGISASRLVAKGYGETQLVNKCADGIPCSEVEHQKNRRTEIKILSIGN